MERLLTVDDVARYLQCSRRSAYTYMGEMAHMERPLRVTQTGLNEWISRKTVGPEKARMKTRSAILAAGFRIPKRGKND